jgi:uncharacterized membrane protein YraQ (UPF0718 family)
MQASGKFLATLVILLVASFITIVFFSKDNSFFEFILSKRMRKSPEGSSQHIVVSNRENPDSKSKERGNEMENIFLKRTKSPEKKKMN